MKPLILIPARMGSKRLPHKPLALIHQEPMIVHVWRKACQAGIAPVVVACDHKEIYDVVVQAGGKAVITQGQHATGSDRLAEAMNLVDPEGQYDVIVNVQGDLPSFPFSALSLLLEPFAQNNLANQKPNKEETDHEAVDIATLIQPISCGNATSVKVRIQKLPTRSWVKCLDFSRKGLYAQYIHQGVYAFTRQALEKFAALPQTEHELSESLEQLRALDYGMNIAGVIIEPDHQFVSVDTPEDLQKACDVLASC